MFVLNACLACALLSGGCHDDKTEPGQELAPSAWGKEFMDMSVRPGEDFYRYALGGWMKSNDKTSTYVIAANELGMIRWEILEDYIAGKDDLGDVVKKEYEVMMDMEAREAGVGEMVNELGRVLACGSREELVDRAIELGQAGYLLLWTTEFLTNQYRIGVNWLTLDAVTPGVDHEDPAMADMFRQHATRVLEMLGMEGEEARRVAGNAFEAERLVLGGRDGGSSNGYFDRYARGMGVSREYFVDKSYEGLAYLFDRGDLEVLRDYLAWCLVMRNEGYLSIEFLEELNVFREQLGFETLEVDEVAVSVIIDVHDRELTRAVCDRLTRPEVTEAYGKVARGILAVARERIEGASWIKDAGTREEALLKLEKMKVYLMGKRVETRGRDGWSSTLAYAVEARRCVREEKTSRRGMYITGEIALDLMMNYLEYNAHTLLEYNQYNVLCGMLTDGVLRRLDDTGFLYGYLGVVMGHELIHNFDNTGRFYDSNGDPRSWWTAADLASYDERARRVSDYYSTLSFEGHRVDGERVLGECIAELGGISIAFEAMKRATGNVALVDADGFTAAQRFFFGYAWYNADTDPAQLVNLYLNDEHVFEPLRVTSTCANTDGWYEAFPEVQPGDKWYIAPENRLKVW